MAADSVMELRRSLLEQHQKPNSIIENDVHIPLSPMYYQIERFLWTLGQSVIINQD